MIHRFFILAALLFSANLCAQVTSLSVKSRIGYDCWHVSDNGDSLRGACNHDQTLDYRTKLWTFKAKRLCDLRRFREYDRGFLPNSIMDSLHNERIFLRRKLPKRKLEAFLLPVLQLQQDSVLVFDAADFSENKELIAVCNDSTAMILQKLNEDFRVFGMVSVMRDLKMSFEMNGVHYELFRDYGNQFWQLRYFSGTGEVKVKFVHTGLDAFLTRRFPKSFEGRFLTSNYVLERQLKDLLKVEDEFY